MSVATHQLPFGLPVSPQARKVLPLIPKLLAEQWGYRQLAQEADIAENTARSYLQRIQAHVATQAEADNDAVRRDAVEVARRISARQIERAERLDEEMEAVIAEIDKGFVKSHYDAKTGGFVAKRYQYDAATKAKILGDLLRGEKTLDDVMRSLSGRGLAEQALLAKVRGDATGKALGAALVDATASELGEQVWDVEAETVPD